MKLNHKLAKRFLAVALSFAMVVTSLFVMPTASEAATKATIGRYVSVKAGTTNKTRIFKLSKKQYAKVSVKGTAKSGITIKDAAGKKITATTKIQGTGKNIVLNVKNYGVPGKSYQLVVKTYNKATNKLVGTYTAKATSIYKKATAVEINEADQTLTVGDTFAFTATKKAANSTDKIVWTSLNPEIATVDANGNVTAVAAGEATIQAKAGNKVDTVKVTVNDVLKVIGVTATAFTTLTITGTKLDELKVSDVVMVGNSANEIKVAEDGKTATITLATALEADAETKVTVLGTEYTVKFVVNAEKIEIVEKVYDDDAADQYCQIKINGVVTDAVSLIANGYTVAFEAWKLDGTSVTGTVFDSPVTGKLDKMSLVSTKDEYIVRATVSKGDVVLVSEKESIYFTNFDNITTGIDAVYFTVTTAVPSTNLTAATTSYVALQNAGNTMVVNEVLTLSEIDLNIEGFIGEYTATSNGGSAAPEFTQTVITSSNPSVISVDNLTKHVLTANSAGTAVIKVAYGTFTKEFTITVTNTKRELGSVKALAASKNVALNVESSLQIQAFDTYNDYVKGLNVTAESLDPSVAELSTTSGGSSAATVAVNTGSYGKAKVYVVPKAVGKTVVTFTYMAKDGTSKIVSTTVNVTNVGGENRKVTLIDNPWDTDMVDAGTATWQEMSADATVDFAADKHVEYSVEVYSDDNINVDRLTYLGNSSTYTGTDASKYVVDLSSSTYLTATSAGTNNVVFTATDIPGRTTATFYLNDADKTVLGQVVITTVNTTNVIKGISFNKVNNITSAGVALKIEDFLSLTTTNTVDPIVNGVTLSKATVAKVRLDVSTGVYSLYLDRNGDGAMVAAEKIGELELVALSDANTALSSAVSSNAYTGSVSGQSGTLAVKLYNADKSAVIATSFITVNVK